MAALVTALAGLAAGALVMLVLSLIFGAFLLPTVLNVFVSGVLARKLAAGFWSRLAAFLVASILISLNFRLPGWFQENPVILKTNIGERVVIGPNEKVHLDSDAGYIFYRRDGRPPSFGMRNDWRFGFHKVETITEHPALVLKSAGIAYTIDEGARVV